MAEAVDEVFVNDRNIQRLTGRKPKFFRSGTAFYDDVAVRIVGDLKEQAVGYSVLGDAGAPFNAEQVKNACLHAGAGSIIILHMNHPDKQTFEGIRQAIPELKRRGFRFVKLEDYPLL